MGGSAQVSIPRLAGSIAGMLAVFGAALFGWRGVQGGCSSFSSAGS